VNSLDIRYNVYLLHIYYPVTVVASLYWCYTCWNKIAK